MSLFSLDNENFSMTKRYWNLNASNAVTELLPPPPYLTPLPPNVFAIIAEPSSTTTFLLNVDQHPRSSHSYLAFLSMSQAAAPTMSTSNYKESSDSRPVSALTDALTLHSEAHSSTQPLPDSNTANETTEDDEDNRRGKKKESARRYDKMWNCVVCSDRLRERTDAKKHVEKKHEGMTFDEAMIRGPNKYRDA